ncbi:MAG: hypothetical protein ACXVUX_13255 [Solirubrobacteraceae bacterium]
MRRRSQVCGGERVFGRRNKGGRGKAEPVAAAAVPDRELPQDPAERERARLLQCWRGSEQRVLRTWHAWQAAPARDKPERYRAYLTALADEERAARSVELATRMLSAHEAGKGLAQPAGR